MHACFDSDTRVQWPAIRPVYIFSGISMFSPLNHLQYTLRLTYADPGLADLKHARGGGAQGELIFTDHSGEEAPSRR